MTDLSRSPGAGEAEALLADMARLRHATRRARHAYAVPTLLFGALTLIAAPLYLDHIGPSELRATLDNPPMAGLGGDLLEHSAAIGWYWLGALIGGYLLTLYWYRRHALTSGVQSPTRRYVWAGVAGVTTGLALGPVLDWLTTQAWTTVSDVARPLLGPVQVVHNLGLVPVFVVAAGLLVLAWLERSLLLATVAGTVLVTLALGAASIASGAATDAFPRYGYLPPVLLSGLILLAAGGVAAARTRRTPA
ncbi:hypothetical protein [Krasilnikovia sp. MM14-A1259]|uniref:hypothetical protein n=1 Tax=Krasilnikovia sp. MM14-A1259 TaxID=3373539 RepID=UPI00382549F7